MSVRLVLASSLLVGLAAGCSCSSDPVPATDAGSDAPAVTDAPATPDAPTADVRTPADAGSLDDAGEPSVRWTVEPEPLTIDRDISLSYGYSWEVTLVGDLLDYSLRLERCYDIAGAGETCFGNDLDPLSGGGSVRWGIDTTMYGIGVNTYWFQLTLSRNGEVVDVAEIELVATVTDCMSCIGGGG